MKGKSKSGVSIIGGADGPTSIFIAGREHKKTSKSKDTKYFSTDLNVREQRRK